MKSIKTGNQKILTKWLYRITVLVLAISGAGQLPISRRYYISDIPGMGWSAKFYTTHYLHYLAATIFIALVFYSFSEYWINRRLENKETSHSNFRVLLIVGIILTGFLLVIKNFSGSQFSANSIIALDISHLLLAIVLGLAALSRKLFHKK